MKTVAIPFLFVVLISLPVSVMAAADVRPGDTASRVAEILGEPEGYLKIQELELLYFDRGTVEIRDGIVVRAELISEDALDVRRAEEKRRRIRQQQERLLARERLIAEGRAVRERTLSDPEFLAADADYRVAFWEAFRKKYPEVDVENSHGAALESLKAAVAARIAAEEERAREREAAVAREREWVRARQLAELRERTAAAERRAEEAARAAERARTANRVYVVGASHYVYPSTVVRAPTVQTSTRICDPVVTRRTGVLRNFTSPWAYDRSYSTPFFNDRHFVTQSSYQTAVTRIGIHND